MKFTQTNKLALIPRRLDSHAVMDKALVAHSRNANFIASLRYNVLITLQTIMVGVSFILVAKVHDKRYMVV